MHRVGLPPFDRTRGALALGFFQHGLVQVGGDDGGLRRQRLREVPRDDAPHETAPHQNAPQDDAPAKPARPDATPIAAAEP